MATFKQILSIWPVSTSIAENLSFGDLLKLSRSNSDCRCALHGFPFLPESHLLQSEGPVRADLYIGEHQNKYWRGLKRLSLQECSERAHTKGGPPQCCRRCSMPVCEACIVKENYKKNEPTFKNRCRYLCVDCWTSGTPHVGRHSTGTSPEFTLSYNFAPGSGDFCVCTVKDGWLCVSCKNEQNAEAKSSTKCVGEGCENSLEEEKESRRICLWCDLPLIKRHHRSENRDPKKDYNFGFVFEGKGIEEGTPAKKRAGGKKFKDARFRERSYDGRQTRLSSVEKRRIERLLQSDDTGAQYVGHFAEIDYKALGARRPNRQRVMDSMQGIFKYDPEFLMQFGEICTREPSEDWWTWVMKLMVGEEGEVQESLLPGTGNDEIEEESDVKGKKLKNQGEEYAEASTWNAENGKKTDPHETETEGEIGSIMDNLSHGDEGGLQRYDPTSDNLNDEGFPSGRRGLQKDFKGKGKKRDDGPPFGGRQKVGPEPDEKPPDYDMCDDDLLLELDGPLNRENVS